VNVFPSAFYGVGGEGITAGKNNYNKPSGGSGAQNSSSPELQHHQSGTGQAETRNANVVGIMKTPDCQDFYISSE